MLGNRPLQYKYDSADFAKYLTTRDTYLENHSHSRRALSVGGFIARLAREALPVSAILMGPSQEALEGKQDVLFCGDEVWVDDGLSEEVRQMICGMYAQETEVPSRSSIFTFLFTVTNCSFLQTRLHPPRGSHPRQSGRLPDTMWVIGTLSLRSTTIYFIGVLLKVPIFLWQALGGE